MGAWIASHTQGWPIFLATTVGLSVAIAVAYARHRAQWVPWLFLLAWALGVLAFYVTTHLDKVRNAWPRMWGGQVLTLLIVVAVPLGLVLAILALWARRRPARWPLPAAVAATSGALAMTLAPSISAWMFGVLKTWMFVGRH